MFYQWYFKIMYCQKLYFPQISFFSLFFPLWFPSSSPNPLIFPLPRGGGGGGNSFIYRPAFLWEIEIFCDRWKNDGRERTKIAKTRRNKFIKSQFFQFSIFSFINNAIDSRICVVVADFSFLKRGRALIREGALIRRNMVWWYN